MAKQSKTKKSSIAVFIGIVAILFALVTTTYSTVKSNLNLGLDLQGGFEILYQVKPLNGGGCEFNFKTYQCIRCI